VILHDTMMLQSCVNPGDHDVGLIRQRAAAVAKSKVQPYSGEQVMHFPEILAKTGSEMETAVDGIL
jgi:hypothetical protein